MGLPRDTLPVRFSQGEKCVIFSSVFQIYTDWANHYLEKAHYKRYITDLQADVCDGVLLADVIHSVSEYPTLALAVLT